MNHATRFQFHDDDVEWSEEQVKDGGEITSLYLASVVLQEGSPSLV